MADRPRVFVVEDDPAVRASITALLRSLDLDVATFPSAAEFLAATPEDSIGCVVLDLYLPGMTGLELLETLTARDFRLPVIMITGNGDVPTALRAMRAGATDFVEKPLDPEEFLVRVTQALDVSRAQERRRRSKETAQQRIASLTPREAEVLRAMVMGASTKQIGSDLGISTGTVEIHRCRVLRKLGARNVADVVRRVAESGGYDLVSGAPIPPPA